MEKVLIRKGFLGEISDGVGEMSRFSSRILGRAAALVLNLIIWLDNLPTQRFI
ncbi:hypothetical protein B14911_01135 [Bacillus sp. NRRL B-14911]|nr:hypothetical protein B14911_01135 [Bacillus sp. NRRL B-14911]